MAVREFSWHTMPALAIEMVCCSIASSRMVRLFWSILSNSSMQQMPRSLSTSAPLSRMNSRVSGSFLTLAVRPTALEPRPLVQMPLGAILQTCCRSWDLAVDGSPTRHMFTSDLNLPLPISLNSLMVPPKSCARMPFFTSSWPQMEGAKLLTRSSMTLGLSAMRMNSFFSSSLNFCLPWTSSALNLFSSRMRKEMRSVQVLNTDLTLDLMRCTLMDCARQMPTTSTLSPGLMPSTLLSQQMMVRECGVSPSDTYSGSSWNLMYCLSWKTQ